MGDDRKRTLGGCFSVLGTLLGDIKWILFVIYL
jgi:hypothetical protein